VSEKAGGDTKHHCDDDEKKCRNHSTESIRSIRYAKQDLEPSFRANQDCNVADELRATGIQFRDIARGEFAGSFDSATRGSRMTVALFRRGKYLVQARLAMIGCVTMNDPALSRFVDRRNDRPNFIGVWPWGGADPLLQTSQVCLNASVSKRLPLCLARTLGS
jgi:hypothetical protein